MEIRMDRFLADAGFGTRSEVKKKLKKEIVEVDGIRIRDAAFRFDPETARVTVNGKEAEYSLFSYYMLNKPAGVVSATRDPLEKTVVDMIPDGRRRDLFPVGRLDKDTTGLLIITNDGKLSHRLLSPKHHVKKEYLVTFSGSLTPEAMEMLRSGVDIGDPELTLPAELEYPLPDEIPALLSRENRCIIRITEGRYHQIKRMFEAVGAPVVELMRLAMGTLRLDPGLAPGESRPLTMEELTSLQD